MPHKSKKPNFAFYLAIAGGVAAVVLLPLVFTSRYTINLLILAASSGVAALGLTVLLGYTGQLSLAQAVFFAIGSYAVALGTTRWNIDWWLALLLGLIFSAVIGLILGLATLKVGGRYLAMVTICLQIVFALIITNWIAVTGGPDGISNIARPWLFTHLDTIQEFAWFTLGILLLSILFVWWIKNNRLGRSMRAVREDELAAEALGIDSLRIKTTAFLLCGMLGALGGGLYASGVLYISPDSFAYNNSVNFLAMILLGGSDSAFGAALGSALLSFLPEALRGFKSVYLIIYGGIIISVIIFMPEGIWGYIDYFTRRFKKTEKLPPAGQTLKIKTNEEADVLKIENIGMYFGGLKALDGVDFVVHKGEIHALIGPNGSGKTTCINVISGVYVPTFGKVKFLGQEITAMKPNRIAKLGLTRTFQNLRLFKGMTVWENVLIGSQRNGGGEEAVRERAIAAIEFVGLQDIVNERCKNLPYGHQKLVELARTLAGEPQLILLDEPAAGLNESEKEELIVLLKRIHDLGLTMLLVEHDMSLVAQLSTQVTVLNFGQKIAEGSVEVALRDPLVVEAYLGNMEVVLDA